jgi:hypothetical protein
MGTDSVSGIDIADLVLMVVSSGFLVLLTLLILQFTAKPKLRVTVSSKDETKKGKLIFPKGKFITLRFELKNVGHWYWARPAASNVTLWVNFEPAFNPRMILFGSDLEKENWNVRHGKDDSKYMKADGIYLFHKESGEAVEVYVQVPEKKRKKGYRFWVTAHANEGGCGVHNFQLAVV